MKRPAFLDDPSGPSRLLFTCLTVAGFLVVLGGWRIAAGTLFVPQQVPVLVSGGFGGLALIIIGLSLGTTQAERQAAANERVEMDALLSELVALAETVRERAS